MSNIAGGFVHINPSYVLPEIVMQYQQPSGAFLALPDSTVMPRLGPEDLAVYVNRLNVKSAYQTNQNVSQQLPSCTIVPSQGSIPTYLLRTRAIYDHHDIAQAAVRGFSLVEAQRLAMRQGQFQGARNGLLYGFNSANTGEGLLNAPGVTSTTLPPDTFGNTTVLSYDNGQMAQYLIQQVVQAKTRMNQMGNPIRAVILGPQRVIGQWQYGIVQLTQYQRPGAGVTSTAGVLSDAIGWNGDTIEFGYDDTLIGQGDGGTDAIMVVFPEIKTPYVGSMPDTNEFAKLTPGLKATTVMLTDLPAPKEIPSPIAGGALDILSEWRVTPGWAIRSQGVTKISMQYS